MPKIAKELNALAVSRLGPGVHQVGGVPGLLLQVTATGGRSWMLRYRLGERRREMGLGPYPSIPLAEARAKAAAARYSVRIGIDPLAQAQAERARNLAEMARRKTFEECAAELIAAKAPSWKSDKHAAQWEASLRDYAFPVLGRLTVDAIEAADVLRALSPIWATVPETASRVRGRIEAVLDYAATVGARPRGANPAAWKGNLGLALPTRASLGRTNHAALPHDGVCEFYARLVGLPGTAAACLRFAMLTCARSGEARGADWSEIDLEAKLWTVPAARMKAEREHVVPLTDQAVALLEALPHRAGLLFANAGGDALSDMSLTQCIRRLDRVEPGRWHDPKLKRLATAHGICRSTFRTWAAECTTYPSAVPEAALAHLSGDEVERAYLRSNFLTMRRGLMAEWSQHLTQKPDAKAGVIAITKRRPRAA
jgi:integrase